MRKNLDLSRLYFGRVQRQGGTAAALFTLGENLNVWMLQVSATCLALFTGKKTLVLIRRSEKLTHFILVAEDVVVDVVLLWALGGEHEGLHKPPHRLPVVGQLAAHLDRGDCKS